MSAARSHGKSVGHVCRERLREGRAAAASVPAVERRALRPRERRHLPAPIPPPRPPGLARKAPAARRPAAPSPRPGVGRFAAGARAAAPIQCATAARQPCHGPAVGRGGGLEKVGARLVPCASAHAPKPLSSTATRRARLKGEPLRHQPAHAPRGTFSASTSMSAPSTPTAKNHGIPSPSLWPRCACRASFHVVSWAPPSVIEEGSRGGRKSTPPGPCSGPCRAPQDLRRRSMTDRRPSACCPRADRVGGSKRSAVTKPPSSWTAGRS